MQDINFFQTNIEKKEGRLYLETTKFYAIELLLASECLHKNLIMHWDIRPDNILLDSEGYIKLCDFNFYKIFKNFSFRTKTLAGSYNIASPKVKTEGEMIELLIGGPMDVFYILCFWGNSYIK